MSPLPRASYGASAGRAQKTETKKTTTTKAKQKNESKNVLLLAMMMLSTANGWVLAPDDTAHDSSHESAITGEADGALDRRQLLRIAAFGSSCDDSWSATHHARAPRRVLPFV